MDTRTQHGYLLLADLSGFTAFLSASELEHAHDVLGELIGLIVSGLTPGLQLVEVEGDAVYVYAPDAALTSGDVLLRLIDDTYVAFRDRVDAIQRHSTCTCNACRSVLLLDLKVIVHYGEYILQEVAGSRKPLGSDVNLVHRLLKNSVSEATGWHAYALLTEPAVERLRIPVDGLHAQIETYESLRPIRTYSFDLHSRYERRTASRHVVVPPEQADLRFQFDLPLSPPDAWDWLNDPAKRSLWEGLPVLPAAGRKGTGSATHCMHGTKVRVIQTILDWHPFEYFTFESRNPSSRRPDSISTVVLQPQPGGTAVDFRVRVDMRPRLLGVFVYRLVATPEYRRSITKLGELTRTLAV
jgi:class 3 adenylate cyclase